MRNLAALSAPVTLLGGEKAREFGGFCLDDEFDLTHPDLLRDRIVEVGRTGVHHSDRNGAVISRLWRGVLQSAALRDYRYLMGCTGIGMADGNIAAADLHFALQNQCDKLAKYRVFTGLDLPLRRARRADSVVMPPVTKGYVRLVSYVGGQPACNPHFNTADLLPLTRSPVR